MEEFQDRLYFGTDIAGNNQETPIVKLFDKLKTEKLISTQAYEKITWKNAVNLLDLKN
jgi:predicted TIM-barrel fold metal-dependent hydrolase